jgi:peptidoglycan/xylan/chitin deacetylase (PgdA/CDA1 family)
MFNYKSLYKIFSILVIAQLSLMIYMNLKSDTIVENSNVEASILQDKVQYIEASKVSSIASLRPELKSDVSLKIKLPILMYHHIDTVDNLPKTDKVGISLSVSPEIFEKQLQYLQKNNYHTINSFQLQDYLDEKFTLPANPVLLTFDDGYKDNYGNAFPILQKYKMVGDFGIVTSVVGQSEYMTWDQLKEMKNAGMSFASHTDHHCTTAIKIKKGVFEDSPTNTEEKPCSKFGAQEKLTVGQIKYEFEKSKNELEKNLDIRVTHLIYPLGFYNNQAKEIAKNLGYSFATTVAPQTDNYTDFGVNPFSLERKRVNGQQTGELSGFFAK